MGSLRFRNRRSFFNFGPIDFKQLLNFLLNTLTARFRSAVSLTMRCTVWGRGHQHFEVHDPE